MVRNLLKAGFSVRGWNRTRGRAEALAGDGMEVADSPADAAREADALIVCVADDEAVRTAAFDSGAIDALAPGAVVIDCSTTSQEMTTALCHRVLAGACEFLDAPITGSKLGAARGQLTIMVSGPSSTLAKARPLFDAMSKHVVHVGEEHGLAQRAKYCQNMGQAIMLQGLLECYTLAKKLGVPLAKMAEIMENSAGKSGVGSFKTPYLMAGDYEPHFKLWLMRKDITIALEHAAREEVPLPLASNVRTLYDQALAEGLGEEDFLALAKLMERWGKVALRD